MWKCWRHETYPKHTRHSPRYQLGQYYEPQSVIIWIYLAWNVGIYLAEQECRVMPLVMRHCPSNLVDHINAAPTHHIGLRVYIQLYWTGLPQVSDRENKYVIANVRLPNLWGHCERPQLEASSCSTSGKHASEPTDRVGALPNDLSVDVDKRICGAIWLLVYLVCY